VELNKGIVPTIALKTGTEEAPAAKKDEEHYLMLGSKFKF